MTDKELAERYRMALEAVISTARASSRGGGTSYQAMTTMREIALDALYPAQRVNDCKGLG